MIKAVQPRVYTVDMDSHAATTNTNAFPLDPTDPPFKVGNILREYGPEYRAAHRLTLEQHKALTDLAKA